MLRLQMLSLSAELATLKKGALESNVGKDDLVAKLTSDNTALSNSIMQLEQQLRETNKKYEESQKSNGMLEERNANMTTKLEV
jgi:hypothetical protein